MSVLAKEPTWCCPPYNRVVCHWRRCFV